MAKHVLIVCEACCSTAEDDAADNHDPNQEQESDGIRLLHQLKELHEQWPRRDELAIETTSCLCICDNPCAIAYVGTGKPSYLFGDLPFDRATAADLLTASELYLDSEDGMVPAFQLPRKLRPCRIARIPAAPRSEATSNC